MCLQATPFEALYGYYQNIGSNHMGIDRKQKLLDLEAECLADALLQDINMLGSRTYRGFPPS